MQIYESEEQQIEAIKTWWRENGNAVILGVVIGFGALGGWKYWQDYQNKRAEQASLLFSEVMVAMEKAQGKDIDVFVKKLKEDYASTPYATLAALAAAKAATVNDANLILAKEHLQWAIDNAQQKEIVPIAKLRLARILLDENDLAAAEQLIEQNQYQPAYAAQVAELRGDLHAAKGDYTAARSAYEAAMSSNPPPLNTQMLQIKRDSVSSLPTTVHLPDIEVTEKVAAEPEDA